ncbi:MAG: hypothetical protein IJZ53_00275 [Tyzzerella sp.]|nr:hypothetical protein [Tyzzerella sp.]
MKRYIVMLIIVLFGTYTLYANAEEGSVEITMPEEAVISFAYAKVADVENGSYVLKEEYKESGVDLNQLGSAKEMEEAIQRLQQFHTKENFVQTGESGNVKIPDLEEGVYLIESLSSDEYQISPMLVAVPAWDVEAGEMSYDISVTPKMEKIPKSVQTGDGSNTNIFSVFFVVSLIIVAILSCQKYFTCGRISE